MRLYSDFLEASDVRKAARLAGVGFTRFSLHGSRKREAAFDIILTGSSRRRQNGGEDMAATWDEWGLVLGTLFTLDPRMIAGDRYESAEHFHWVTGGRFKDNNLRPSTQCRDHKWGLGQPNVTGVYSVAECERGCGAIQRWMIHGRKYDDISVNAF